MTDGAARRESRTSEPGSQLSTRPLDGVRGMAALMVFVSHLGVVGYFPAIRGYGQLGVVLFFVLSGFLMGLLYMNHVLAIREWGQYALRRIFRVYPMYVVTVVGSLLLFEGLGFGLPVKSESLVDHLTLRFATHHLWTIPVEIKFYACFPFVALPVALIGSSRIRIALIAGLIALLMAFAPRDDVFAVWGYLDFFLAGVLAAQLHLDARAAEARGVERSARAAVWSAAVVAGFACLALLIPAASERALGVRFQPFSDSWATAPPCFLIVLAATRCGGWVSGLLTSRPARFLGSVSYSLYLTHAHVLRLVHYRSSLPAPLKIAIITALTLLVAWICFRFIETPFREVGRRLATRLAVPPLAARAAS